MSDPATHERVAQFAHAFNIRDDIAASISAYVVQRRRTGDFLRAVLANDLMEAAGRADHINGPHLQNVARFVFNAVPGRARGSFQAVDAWLSGETAAETP